MDNKKLFYFKLAHNEKNRLKQYHVFCPVKQQIIASFISGKEFLEFLTDNKEIADRLVELGFKLYKWTGFDNKDDNVVNVDPELKNIKGSASINLIQDQVRHGEQALEVKEDPNSSNDSLDVSTIITGESIKSNIENADDIESALSDDDNIFEEENKE